MHWRYLPWTAVTAAWLLAGPGCHSGKPPRPATVPAEAVVTLDGQPVEGAQVTFWPEDAAQQPASGKTGPHGTCRLSTYGSMDGASAGWTQP